MSRKIWLPIAFVVFSAGCIPPPATSSSKSGGAASPPAAPTSPAPVAEQPAAPTEPTERIVAEVGVGQKGRSLDEHQGMIVTPLKAFLRTQERLTFEVQLKQALDLYAATNGSKPKSHEEYMSKVVEANGIKLPELPPGHQYVYDPQRGELMVERPAQ